MSLNTFSVIIYDVINANDLQSAFFFIICVIILVYGLASSLIAVIASYFKARTDFDSSANMDTRMGKLFKLRKTHLAYVCQNKAGKAYQYLLDITLLLIMVDLGIKASAIFHKKCRNGIQNLYLGNCFDLLAFY